MLKHRTKPLNEQIMKRVSFEVAKALKGAGYPQRNDERVYLSDGCLVPYHDYYSECFSAPFVMKAWLWLWREKTIRFSVKDLWDAKIPYTGRGCTSSTNQLGGICTPEVADPEEAISIAIEHLVEHNLIQ